MSSWVSIGNILTEEYVVGYPSLGNLLEEAESYFLLSSTLAGSVVETNEKSGSITESSIKNGSIQEIDGKDGSISETNIKNGYVVEINEKDGSIV